MEPLCRAERLEDGASPWGGAPIFCGSSIPPADVLAVSREGGLPWWPRAQRVVVPSFCFTFTGGMEHPGFWRIRHLWGEPGPRGDSFVVWVLQA